MASLLFLFSIGVIVFGSDQEVAELMKAVKRLNATGHFNWIGSDGWSARALVSDGEKYFLFRVLCHFPSVMLVMQPPESGKGS